MGEWRWEWSHADPPQCWFELWQLWSVRGIKDQLAAPPSSIGLGTNGEEVLGLLAHGDDWAQYCD